MKAKYFFLFLICLVSSMTYAQIGGEDEVYLNGGGELIQPKFQGGGLDKFQEFVKERFDYSKVKKAGSMLASFTIETDGSVKKVKILKMIDVDSGLELMRVLNLSPKWEPAKRAGKPVSIEIKYPMNFKHQ